MDQVYPDPPGVPSVLSILIQLSSPLDYHSLPRFTIKDFLKIDFLVYWCEND
ncbi:hypothetical protein CLOBOL_00494 [Enterocloster bolteae ATCC BAA-613]|uniref:Uncharacterized protein n=1 Tax=Enterocloster bolteae (strain ATCC BAA-613 / DSM 15670 / CCUG 46953 / JCM 12243 / WAL 16351) TaxID=411902 RepID=A8RHS7_ENTBW|nr:hypothetical protein CLOBOL_00494 [Enterocloster bolteae ATCC BAA-613]